VRGPSLGPIAIHPYSPIVFVILNLPTGRLDSGSSCYYLIFYRRGGVSPPFVNSCCSLILGEATSPLHHAVILRLDRGIQYFCSLSCVVCRSFACHALRVTDYGLLFLTMKTTSIIISKTWGDVVGMKYF